MAEFEEYTKEQRNKLLANFNPFLDESDMQTNPKSPF